MIKTFSTGLGELDVYLGGVRPGDTLLFVQSASRDARPLCKAFAGDLRKHDRPLIYLNLTDSWRPVLTGARMKNVSPPTPAAGRTTGLYRWASARVRSIRPGECVILDDLSEWERRLGSGGKLQSFIQLLAKTTARRKGFAFLTASRPGIRIETLTALKDIVDLCVELTVQEGDLLLHPLQTRGRSPARPGSPFGFRLHAGGRRGSKHLSAIPDFHEGPGNRLRLRHEERERISALLMDGPLRMEQIGIVVADMSGSFRAVNDTLLKRLGLTGVDVSSINVLECVAPGGRRAFLKFLAAAAQGRGTSAELLLCDTGGKHHPVHVRSDRLDAGLTVFFVHDNREGASALKRARALASENALLFNDAPYPLCVTDGRKVLAANRAFMAIWGDGAEPPVAGTREKVPTLRECFEGRFLRKIRESISGGGDAGERAAPQALEGPFLTRGGRQIQVRVTLSAPEPGTSGGSRLLVEDISGYVGRIAALEAGDRRFRGMVERMTRPAGLLKDNTIVYANPALLALLGYPPGATGLAGTPIAVHLAGGEGDAADRRQGSRGPRREQWVTETSLKRSDSTLIDARLTFMRMNGVPEADTLLEIEDLTALKSEEARLAGMREGAERIRDIIEATTATLDHERLLQVALDKSLEILGWTGGIVYTLDQATRNFTLALQRKVSRKLLGKISELPADEGLGGFVHKTLESHVIAVESYPSYLPLGTLFREHGIRRISLVPLVHRETPLGFILGMTGTESTDFPSETLTVLGRQLGNALANARRMTDVQESEGTLHRAVDSLSGIVYTSGPDGLIRSIDQGVSGLLGYGRKDFNRNRSLYLSLIHDEDKKIYLERVTGSETLPATFVREYRMRPKARAAYIWVRDSVSVMRDREDRVTGFTGLLSDVTPERESLREIQAERTILRSVQDVIPDGIAAFDSDGRCVEWNPTMERITGLGRQGAIGRKPGDLVPLPEGVTSEMVAEKAREGGTTGLGVATTGPEGGSRREVTLVPVPGHRGEAPGFLLRYTDVTAREKEIQELLESEKILLNVLNAMDDVMTITDLGGRVVEVNQAFLKCTGYSRSEVVGQEFPYPWLDENDMGRFLEWIARIREQRWLHDFDLTWITRRGARVRMSLNTTPIRNSYGEPVAMLNIARDITERVRLTGDLEARNTQIEMINRIITLANVSDDFSEVFNTVAREVVRVVPSQAVFLQPAGGLDPEFSRIENFGPDPLEPGEMLPVVESLGAGGPGEGGARIIGDLVFEVSDPVPVSLTRKVRAAVLVPLAQGGKTVGVFGVVSREPHSYTEEHASQLVPLVRQLGGIIERRNLFRQVASDSTYVRNLLDSIDSPVYTVDNAHVITQINRAGIDFLREFTGPGERDFQGVNIFTLLADTPLRSTLEQGVRSGGYSAEIALDSGSGRKIIRVTVNSLRDGGAASGFVFSHADITNLKKTEEELRDRARQLITLHDISTMIGNTYDVKGVLSSALSMLKSAIGADAVAVYLTSQGTGELVLEHQDGFPPGEFDTIRVLNPEDSVTGHVVKRREAQYIERKVERDERISPMNREFLTRQSMQAMAIIPIVVKDRVPGALDIFYRDPHDFPEGERHLLNLVGNRIGAAIENAQLYRELTAQVERLSILFELSRSLTSLLDTNRICRAVFDHVRRVAGCRRCVIRLLDRRTGNLIVKLHAECEGDRYSFTAGGREADAGDRVDVAGVIAGRKTHLSADRTTAIVPMVSEETITGVIEVVTAGEGFDEVQVRLLESIGSLTAIALEKGNLYEETVEKSDEIEQRNRELDDFTYVVSHDLKEPLISIEGFSRILQMDYSDVIREEGRGYLDSLVGATTRMKGLIDDLLQLSRVSRPSESFRAVDIAALVEEIRADMEFLIRNRNVSLTVIPGAPAVNGNETQLKILFRNLIANAVKFNDKPRPEVEIGFRIHENNSYLFWVKDNGIGIEEEFFSKIFVIFQRLHRREEFEGSGAGLAIVKKIIETHQGKIWVESVKGEGSTFFFILPADSPA